MSVGRERQERTRRLTEPPAGPRFVQNAINVCGSEETPSVMFIGQLGIDIEGRYQDVRALFASRPSLTSLSRPNALFFERACSVAYGCTMHLLALMAACTSKLWVMHTL